ncbi:MAG: RnfABCDGE type electron transport complex subunit G [Clostridia bacterium]|nr:RnfABCDGE type electron transport complex subunit G [Clostridia bacterium]
MLNKNDGIEIARVGFILFAITAIAAAILAGVNGFTAPLILENNRRTQEAAMKTVLPQAKAFEAVEFSREEGSVVTEIYSGGDAGVAVKVTPNGYGGEISMIVGIDNEYKVTGIEIISQSETAGLGSNCTKEEFKAQFVGKTENIEVVKNGATGNQVDAISSATITTKAVTRGVNEAVNTIKSMRGGE